VNAKRPRKSPPQKTARPRTNSLKTPATATPARPKKTAAATPHVDLQLDGLAPAKLKLSRVALAKILAGAWEKVPADRRPPLPLARRIAVDLHVVSDETIAPLNLRFMRHTGPTDVLSFPLGEFDPERRALHAGEIVVSFETARREAAARGLPYEQEFARYCVHGFLHLLGYDDTTAAQRKAMFAVQEAALNEA
jgi:probable rRNA maturation factor